MVRVLAAGGAAAGVDDGEEPDLDETIDGGAPYVHDTVDANVEVDGVELEQVAKKLLELGASVFQVLPFVA